MNTIFYAVTAVSARNILHIYTFMLDLAINGRFDRLDAENYFERNIEPPLNGRVFTIQMLLLSIFLLFLFGIAF